MLVCHCHVVSDRAVRAAVRHGARDVDAVMAACGAGGDCGGCLPGIERLIADAEVAVRDPALLAARQPGPRRSMAARAFESVRA